MSLYTSYLSKVSSSHLPKFLKTSNLFLYKAYLKGFHFVQSFFTHRFVQCFITNRIGLRFHYESSLCNVALFIVFVQGFITNRVCPRNRYESYLSKVSLRIVFVGCFITNRICPMLHY